MYACMCACTYVRMYTRMHACARVFIYMFTHTPTPAPAYIYTDTDTDTSTSTSTCTYTYTYTYTYAYTQRHVCVCVSVQIHTQLPTTLGPRRRCASGFRRSLASREALRGPEPGSIFAAAGEKRDLKTQSEVSVYIMLSSE